MWKAKLTEVKTSLDKDNEYIDLFVNFYHTDLRVFNKSYRVYLDELTEVSLAVFKTMIDKDKAKLIKIDSIKNVLDSKIGIEI